MLCYGTHFVDLLYIDHIVNGFTPSSETFVPSLSVDFSENNLQSGLSMFFIKYSVPESMEVHARYLFMSLIQKGITIISCPPFEYIGRQLFRQIEGFDVFEAVIEHFGPHHVFKVSHDFCHILINSLLPLKCFKDHYFDSEFSSFYVFSPFKTESHSFLCSHIPFQDSPLLLYRFQNLFSFNSALNFPIVIEPNFLPLFPNSPFSCPIKVLNTILTIPIFTVNDLLIKVSYGVLILLLYNLIYLSNLLKRLFLPITYYVA